MQAINLSTSDFENIKSSKKCIGSGVDGVVYKINNNTIYKFYHKDNNFINLPNVIKDNEGVIISDIKNLRPYIKTNKINEGIYYTDSDGVILTREEAIHKAIEKQKNVKFTELPRNIIYVNNKIAGCEYKYYPNKMGIYASVYLPLKSRIEICRKLIEKVKELLNNNIYPVTLAQSEEFFPFRSKGSNVLIGLDLDPIIIDLDGISAMYSDNFSERYYNRVLLSLSALILELLSKVKLANNICDDEFVIEDNIARMYEVGIPIDMARKFFDNYRLELNEMDDIIKTLKLTKK